VISLSNGKKNKSRKHITSTMHALDIILLREEVEILYIYIDTVLCGYE